MAGYIHTLVFESEQDAQKAVNVVSKTIHVDAWIEPVYDNFEVYFQTVEELEWPIRDKIRDLVRTDNYVTDDFNEENDD